MAGYLLHAPYVFPCLSWNVRSTLHRHSFLGVEGNLKEGLVVSGIGWMDGATMEVGFLVVIVGTA